MISERILFGGDDIKGFILLRSQAIYQWTQALCSCISGVIMAPEITGITTTQCNSVLLRAISTLGSGHGWQKEQFLKKPWRAVATSVGHFLRKFEIINRLDNECCSPNVADSLKAIVFGVSSSWERIAQGPPLEASAVKSSTMANCNLYKIPPNFRWWSSSMFYLFSPVIKTPTEYRFNH